MGFVMSFLQWINQNLERVCAAFLLAFIVGLISVNVVMRYILNSSLSWGEELTLWCFVWFIWLAISYGFQKGEHIRITVFRQALSPKGQTMLDIIVDILILVFFGILIFECINLIRQPFVMSQRSVVLGLPIPILYLSAPVGAALSSYRVVQHLIGSIQSYRDNGQGASS